MNSYQHLFHAFIIAIVLLSTKINSMDQEQPLKTFKILKHTFVQSRKDPELFNSADNQFCLIDRDLFIIVKQTHGEYIYQLYYNKVRKETTFSRPTLHEDISTDGAKHEKTLSKFLGAYKTLNNLE